ncbi:MAG: heme o synthase [Acidobacteriota bacterium]
MGAGTTPGEIQSAIAAREAGASGERISAYFALTKPRVTVMVLLTTRAGFYLASPQGLDLLLLFHTLLGTALLAGGTAGLNQILECEADSRMHRTRNRPLPSKRLEASAALGFTAALVVSGALYLGLTVNPLTALLGVLTSILYLFVYTPLKTRTPLCTAVGAIPGAIPPLMGWTAVSNGIDGQAATLFLILFFWQFPHFYAISWMYRDDYRRGGFRMLPAADPQGRRTGRHILVHSLLLLGISSVPFLLGSSGWIYLSGALLLGLIMLWYGARTARSCTTRSASRVMRASVIYLPLLLILLAVDKL